MSNVEQARFNMVEQQIRPWDVLDSHVLDLLKKLKREQFVPAEKQALAFMDLDVPLGYGASMWQPKVEARVLQALRLKPEEHVLEVGTGSGYMTALLAYSAGYVTSIEIVPELSVIAAYNLAGHYLENLHLEVGDAAQGWEGKYDAIVLTGSVPELPESYLNALNVGGRLFAIVGDAPIMLAKLITCIAPGSYKSTTLFETCVSPLQNVKQPERFTF